MTESFNDQESAAPPYLPPLSRYVLHWLTIDRRIPFPARTVINYALRGEFILEGMAYEIPIPIKRFEKEWDFGA
jgi:hypothetical protein